MVKAISGFVTEDGRFFEDELVAKRVEANGKVEDIDHGVDAVRDLALSENAVVAAELACVLGTIHGFPVDQWGVGRWIEEKRKQQVERAVELLGDSLDKPVAAPGPVEFPHARDPNDDIPF